MRIPRWIVVWSCILWMGCMPALSASLESSKSQLPLKIHSKNGVPINTKKRLVKILSIDGGGVRGVIPAIVLENLESRLPKGHRLAEHFDIIAGTSAGGIIALLLATPDQEGKPKYTASFIADASLNFLKAAFARSTWQTVKSMGGWMGAKYDPTNLKENLALYFQHTRLKQAVTDVIVPAYEIEEDKTFFFKSNKAKEKLDDDCYLKDLAYATAAAPTYFPPARLSDGVGKIYTLIDGGVSANNPALAAAVHARAVYGPDIDVFVVSIGTGTTYGSAKKKVTYESVKTSGLLGWASSIVPLLMHTADAIVDCEMYYVLNFNKPHYYFRMQTTLEPENADLDNISEANIQVLKNQANQLVQKYDKELAHIARVLTTGKYVLWTEKEERLTFN